jgi:hypothetical protein
MVNDKKKILSRLRKVLALADSPEPEEAASALRKAQLIMVEYGLTVSDVELSKVEVVERPMGRQKPTGYQLCLIKIIERVFSVKAIASTRYTRNKAHGIIKFIGVGASAKLAGYCYTYLYRRLSSERKDFYDGLSKRRLRRTRVKEADVFAEFWIMSVERAIQHLIPKGHTLHPAVIAYHMSLSLKPVATKFAKVQNRHADAAWKGMQAGSKVQVNKPMNGGHAPLSLSSQNK